ncbi:hypothetical protein B0H11DRAFT_1921537 [Mycena galericulata]|nr:hypothetical protein B0H11DRAFT_1921537 [Mycena galericulata]
MPWCSCCSCSYLPSRTLVASQFRGCPAPSRLYELSPPRRAIEAPTGPLTGQMWASLSGAEILPPACCLPVEAHTGPLMGWTPGISSAVSTRRGAHWASNGRDTGQAVGMSIRRGAHWASNGSDTGNLLAMSNHLTGWTQC